MTSTLPGIQVTNRCVAYNGYILCGDPAPYLIGGYSYCGEHALTAQERRKP